MSLLILSKKILIFLFVSFYSCSLTDSHFSKMEPLELLYFSPYNKIVELDQIDKIELIFSKPLSQPLFEYYFTLKEGDVFLKGKFIWKDDTHVEFYPYYPFKSHKDYTFNIPISIESKTGCSLRQPFSFTFSTHLDKNPPRIIKVSPSNKSSLLNNLTPIVISFSEAIDKKSLFESLSFFPGIKGSYLWQNGDSELYFQPYYPLEKGIEYRISINKELQDLKGNSLTEPFSSTFNTKNEEDYFQILTLSNGNGISLVNQLEGEPGIVPQNNWHCKWPLCFSFFDSVDIESLLNHIEIEPPLPFEWESKNQRYQKSPVLHFLKRPLFNTLYRVTIKKGFVNEFGQVGLGSLFYFFTNHPSSKPPTINDVAFLLKKDDLKATIIEDYQNFSFSTYHEGAPSFIDFYISFAEISNQNKTQLLFNFLDAFEFKISNLALGVTVQEIEILSGEDSKLARVAESEELIFRISLFLEDKDEGGLGELGLSSKFTDSLGNSLKENFNLRFQVE